MAEPFIERRTPKWPFALFALAAVTVVVDPHGVLDFWSGAPWAVLLCLVFGIGGLKLAWARLEFAPEGVRVFLTRSRGTLVRWEEITDTRVAPWSFWREQVGPQRVWRVETSFVLQLVNSAGVPLLVNDGTAGPLNTLVAQANERTPHLPYEWVADDRIAGRAVLERVGEWTRVRREGVTATPPAGATEMPAPRDSDIALRPTPWKGRTRFYAIAWILVTASLAVWFRLWSDPDPRGWVLTFAPSVFLIPLGVVAAFGEFGASRYALVSRGDTFDVGRSTWFWKHGWQGHWSQITATRVDITRRVLGTRFVIELAGGEPIELPRPPVEVVTWISERTPLAYGWEPLRTTNLPILEAAGDLARVSRKAMPAAV
jgi:hypothetical protein